MWCGRLDKRGITVDARRPNVIRVAPTPLYNTFKDVFDFVHTLRHELTGEEYEGEEGHNTPNHRQ